MTMDPTRDGAPAGATAPEPGPSLHPSVEFARTLGDALGREDFLRRLIDLLRSPDGAGTSNVWILRRAAEGRLDVTHQVPRRGDEPPVDPLAAGGPVAAAWASRHVAWSEDGDAAGPWASAWAVGAFAFRTGAGADQLLVASWDAAEPRARGAFEAVAHAAREAARRFELIESARRAEDQRAAMAEWLRTGASAHHVSEVFRATSRAAMRVSGAEAIAIWTGEPGTLALVHTAGEPRDRESLARALAARAAEIAARGQGEILSREDLSGPGWNASGLARAALVPVAAFGRVLGVLAAFDAAGAEGGEPRGDDLASESLGAIADGLGLLLDRAERAEAARAVEQQVQELRARLRRRERLATVGERASGALGEARHPLASIGAFARRAHREMAADDPRREYLEVILRESERLERLIAESAEPLAPEPPRFRLESLNAVLQDVLPGVGEKLVRRRVRLLKRLDPESPRLLLDVERIRQVVKNVIERAVESVPIGGRVRVESRLVRDHVIAEIAFDGGHAPGDLLEELFVPFTPAAASGAPGLGVADQIIRQHGGEIRVRADGEWGASVLITLPVRGNEERRRTRADRRLIRSDRRQVAGAE